MDVLTEGYALPVSGGLYPPPPYLYRGATAIIASYEADPAAITGLLPPGVTPLEDPPVCLAWVVHYPFSTLGVYNEAIMLVRVSFDDGRVSGQDVRRDIGATPANGFLHREEHGFVVTELSHFRFPPITCHKVSWTAASGRRAGHLRLTGGSHRGRHSVTHGESGSHGSRA